MEKQTIRINKLVLDREQLLDHFPTGLKIAEIGVLRGRYSKKIMKTAPKQLVLIDCWKRIEGDNVYVKHDGCNVEDAVHEKKYQHVCKMFEGNEAVNIIRKLSGEAAEHLVDGYLDAVYIDGDHSYEGCLSDLRVYSKKINETGFMWGHDYTNSYKWIQVQKAIQDFLTESPEWSLLCITSEVPKKSPSWILVQEKSVIKEALTAVQSESVTLEF